MRRRPEEQQQDPDRVQPKVRTEDQRVTSSSSSSSFSSWTIIKNIGTGLLFIILVCAYDRMGLGFSKRALQNESSGTEKVWAPSTTGRMVDDLHRLLRGAEIDGPYVLVGSELGALNARFYSHIHDAYGELLASLQARQLSAATGLSRMLLILGVMETPVLGDGVAEDVVQRQKYFLSNPAHQSSAVDEHYFLNESAAQVRDMSRFKPLTARMSVSVMTGESFDSHIPEHLNQMVAKLQNKLVGESYPWAGHAGTGGADRRAIYRRPSAVSQHLRSVVRQRQASQRSA
ncbi:hypothetical protein CRUP_006732 [Coryphaenoides rupestris]|nr:hypothetical protein CRUP_006732 [Coryphaenoides rupestris]